eukprot:762659-Hanusia_phi.AAC.3
MSVHAHAALSPPRSDTFHIFESVSLDQACRDSQTHRNPPDRSREVFPSACRDSVKKARRFSTAKSSFRALATEYISRIISR